MKKWRVLVFPCGSEIGLEVYRSLRYSAHIELLGANSVDDHGRFIYEQYVGDVPFVDSEDFIGRLQKIVRDYRVDAIYPTMDKTIWKIKSHEAELGCKVISSPAETTEICMSKTKTYKMFQDRIKVPDVYSSLDKVSSYPVFVKPDIGYGTRGVSKANDLSELRFLFRDRDHSDYVMIEYLPGEEYTVDCFTDRHGALRFCGPRQRIRVSNGISVNTKPVETGIIQFKKIAGIINSTIRLRGAWFFQVKKDANGDLTLLEVASRLGGSSALYRALGVNFALLSVYDAFEIDVDIMVNNYGVELDRALDNKYKTDLKFSNVYVDFDDCLILDGKVNTQLISFLFECFNQGKRLILLTKHSDNIQDSLRKYRLTGLFDQVIHIDKNDNKINYVQSPDSILIDDSFQERKEVKTASGIPVFGLDMIELFL